MKLVTAASPEWVELATLTNANKRAYAAKHDFGFEAHTHTPTPSINQQRVEIWRNMIDSKEEWSWFSGSDMLDSKDANWYWWTGADLIVMDFAAPLPDLSDCHFLVGVDVNGINCDSFFVDSSDKSKRLLDRIIELTPTEKDEQEAMARAIKERPDGVKLVPQRQLNSYDYRLYPYHTTDGGGQYQPGDLAFHAPGLSYAKKLEVIKLWLTRVQT